MSINRRDIIEILRDENQLLKQRNQQVSNKLARLQQAFRVLVELDDHARSLTSEQDLQELLYRLLELVMHACNIEHGSLLLVDEHTDELEFVEVIGDTRDALRNHRIRIDSGVVGQALSTRQAVLIENVHSAHQWSSEIDEFLGFRTQALMCAPLVIDDRAIGAIEVVTQANDPAFDENDLNVLKVAARFVSLILERVERLTVPEENGK
jgi:GAF domain-containing protein